MNRYLCSVLIKAVQSARRTKGNFESGPTPHSTPTSTAGSDGCRSLLAKLQGEHTVAG